VIYTLDEWLDVILPYPTLSKISAQPELVNDVIKTKVPDIIHGLVVTGTKVESRPFYCYLDDDDNLKLDTNPDIIQAFISSVKNMSDVDIVIINNRNIIRKRYIEFVKPIKK